jgi:hypothetical protein
VELIKKGERQGLWKYKETSNELVQPQAKPETKTETVSGAPTETKLKKCPKC